MMEQKWKVLLIIDESIASEKASECAIDLCLSGLDTEINLLYVADVEPMPFYSEKDEKKLFSKHRAKANKKMLDILEKLKAANVNTKVLDHYFGIAGEKIEKLENEEEIDLIILGAEKPSIFKKLFGERYTERAIFDTRAPVLVVKPEYMPKIKALIDAGVIEPSKVVERRRQGVTT